MRKKIEEASLVQQSKSSKPKPEPVLQQSDSIMPVPEPVVQQNSDSIDRKQLELDDKKRQLEQLSQYGGGVNAAGQPVPYRASNPRSDLKRPRGQLPEIWNLATNSQKQAIENENAAKRNKSGKKLVSWKLNYRTCEQVSRWKSIGKETTMNPL